MASLLDSLLEKIKGIREENRALKNELKEMKKSKKNKKSSKKESKQETLF